MHTAHDHNAQKRRSVDSAQWLTIANIITALRILVAPFFFYLLVQGSAWSLSLALMLFAGAAITDFFDGVLARRLGVISDVGIFLDPLADKILVLSALFGFVVLDIVPLWAVSVVAIRDVIATALRIWSLSLGKPLRPSGAAKWKTFLQMGYVVLVLALLVLESWWDNWVASIARVILESGAIEVTMYVIVVLTAWSLVGYFRHRDQ
ncbi:MAG: CDP-alcohol phosphatidyltransferase family protein [Chlorobi bacterium]|nr:CDP-alcohol phosphatidyltransferase family protein [Chlorobiota bacterium]